MQHQSLSVCASLDKGLQMQKQLQAQLSLIHRFSNTTTLAWAEGGDLQQLLNSVKIRR